MENRGWIKLHRQMLDWEWYDDLPTCRLFLHLLMTANFEPTRYHGFEVPAGGLVIGREALAKAACLTSQQVRTALDKLKSTNEITIKSNNHFSIVTITCWEKYQSNNQQINQPITNQQPTDNQPITTDKELKNITTLESKKPKELEESISCAQPEHPTLDLLATIVQPEPTQLLKQAATAAVEETDTVEQAPIAEQKPAKHEYPAEFEAFWLAYPRHIAKKHAFKAWKVAIKHTHAAMIIETAKEFAASMKREGRKLDYIPHPATWLNGDRWEDHAADDAVLPAKTVDRSAITDDEWERAVSMFKIRASSWDEIRYGGEPDMSYNQIPLHILAKHGYGTPNESAPQ